MQKTKKDLYEYLGFKENNTIVITADKENVFGNKGNNIFVVTEDIRYGLDDLYLRRVHDDRLFPLDWLLYNGVEYTVKAAFLSTNDLTFIISMNNTFAKPTDKFLGATKVIYPKYENSFYIRLKYARNDRSIKEFTCGPFDKIGDNFERMEYGVEYTAEQLGLA